MHKRKNCLPLIVFAFSILLSGCITLYKPNAVYSPMLEKKGDGNIAASLSASGNGLLSFQGAYALGNNFGVMADGMYHYKKSNYSTTTTSGNEVLNILSGEFGLGYFEKPNTDKNLLLQFYGGAGMGKSNDKIIDPNDPDPEATAKFMNIFLQPGVAFKWERIEMGVDMRANYVRMYDINAYLYEEFEWWNTEFQFTSDSTLQFMILEPCFTFKAGGKNLKFTAQAGVIIPAINDDAYFAVNSASALLAPLFKLSFGMSYSFGRKQTASRY